MMRLTRDVWIMRSSDTTETENENLKEISKEYEQSVGYMEVGQSVFRRPHTKLEWFNCLLPLQ